MKICAVDELEEGTARTFCIHERQEVFLIRQGGQVPGYLNRCPHSGAPLNWLPDRFLDSSGTYIQCSEHDALFSIEDGLCVYGPCHGQSLTPVNLVISAGQLTINTSECE